MRETAINLTELRSDSWYSKHLSPDFSHRLDRAIEGLIGVGALVDDQPGTLTFNQLAAIVYFTAVLPEDIDPVAYCRRELNDRSLPFCYELQESIIEHLGRLLQSAPGTSGVLWVDISDAAGSSVRYLAEDPESRLRTFTFDGESPNVPRAHYHTRIPKTVLTQLSERAINGSPPNPALTQFEKTIRSQ